jgi:hypothetical protein
VLVAEAPRWLAPGGALVVEPVGAGEQGARRLPVAHDRGQVVVGGDVGRVRHDHVDRSRQLDGQGGEPLPFGDAHTGGGPTEPNRVRPGHGEGLVGRVGEPDLDPLPLGGQRQADRPRAGAEVDRDELASPLGDERTKSVELVEGQSGHHLGLGSGDQHPPVDEQVEGAEAPAADDVLQRFTGDAPLEHQVEEVHAALGGGVVEAERVLGPLVARRPLDDAAGLDAGGPGIGDARLGEATLGLGGEHPPRDRALGQRGRGHPSRSRSWVARSSAIRASTTSSRSPASTLSSL